MEYGEFKDALIERLKDFYSSDAEIIVKEVLKTNGVRLEGLSIVHNTEEKVYPVIYLEDIYKNYADGDMNFDDVVGMVIDTREKRNASDGMIEYAGKLTDWDYVKECVYPILLNAKYNTEYLKELVSRPYLDLSIAYIIRIPTAEFDGNANVKISKGMLKSYRISEDELHEQAMFNLRNKDRQEFKGIGEVLMELAGRSIDMGNMTPKMYVLYGETRDYGASQILNIGKIKEEHDGQAYYVIPSSIHECILIEYDEEVNPQMINEMIRGVNGTELDARDVLSDHVYFYDGVGDTISMCA